MGARVKLTLRRCHRTEFSVIHRRVFFSLPKQPNETSVSLGHVQAQPLAEARWVPAYDPEAGPQGTCTLCWPGQPPSDFLHDIREVRPGRRGLAFFNGTL